MLRALAILRTIALVVIVGYTLWKQPIALMWSSEIRDTTMVDTALVGRAGNPAWIAIAWIAMDTLLGWALARWYRRRSAYRISDSDLRLPSPPRP